MVTAPELKSYMDKRLSIQLNGSRKVVGTLRGFDVFCNITLDEAFEEQKNTEKLNLGMVVIRGNSIISIEKKFKKKLNLELEFKDYFFNSRSY